MTPFLPNTKMRAVADIRDPKKGVNIPQGTVFSVEAFYSMGGMWRVKLESGAQIDVYDKRIAMHNVDVLDA